MNKKLALIHPQLEPLERKFVRYMGAMARAWGTKRYEQLSDMFSQEFPGGPETGALLSRIADKLLSRPAITYHTEPVKTRAELRASDVPRGLDLDDLVTD